MITNEIIKTLECCKVCLSTCSECPLNNTKNCRDELIILALDLIKRQQTKIENLKENFDDLNAQYLMQDMYIEGVRAEAIKEFAERLKDKLRELGRFVVYNEDIDNLVKELTEVKDDE